MARMSPQDYHPILSFRFQVTFSVLEGIGFWGKSVTLPSATNNPITIEYGNTYVKVKGKTRWNDVTMTCYAFEGMTNEQLWKWLNELHQKVDEGKDYYADQYKRDVTINLMNPKNDATVGTWKLIGAFISDINFGSLDFASEEIVQPEITISYDYAIYEPKQTSEPAMA